MNRLEHLLGKIAEECAEIAQRAAKAQQFGLAEVQPGQEHNNAERINHEFNDLLGVLEMVCAEAGTDEIMRCDRTRIDAKKAKVERFLDYAAECGTLDISHDINGSLK